MGGSGRNLIISVIVLTFMISASSCSINKLVNKKLADALSSQKSGTVFTGDNDPELVGDALPFAIKMYESVLASVPDHQGLQLKTGSVYVMYANAYLHTPASMMSDDEYDAREFKFRRAKNLYLRGRDILIGALDKKYPGFKKDIHNGRHDSALSRATIEDTDILYWTGAGWMGAYAIDPFDSELGLTLPVAASFMKRVQQLKPAYSKGAINDFFIMYYGSLPEHMGGSAAKAREYFKKSVNSTENKTLSPYLSLATSVSIKEQNVKEFRSLLNSALKIDITKFRENLLVNTIYRRKAKWYLKHEEDFFLTEDK